MSENTKGLYVVFACPACQRWTYAKTTQKSRRCGYCNKMNRLESIHGTIVAGVNQAHILANKNDHEWLLQQGVHFSTSNHEVPTPTEEAQETFSEKILRIHQLVEEELRIKGLTMGPLIPRGYLEICFNHCNDGTLSFDQYLRYVQRQQNDLFP